MPKAAYGEVSVRGEAWRSCPLLEAWGGGDGEPEARPVGVVAGMVKSEENRRKDGGIRVPAHAWGPHVIDYRGFHG